MATVQLEHDEDLDSLFVTGPGVDLRKRFYINSNTGTGSDRLRFNCQKQFYWWNTCGCLDGRLGEAHGDLQLSWRFEADPAEAFRVTPSKDPLLFSPGSSNPDRALLNVQAIYADGTPAPFEDRTPLDITEGTPYGALQTHSCSFGCGPPEYGSSVTATYEERIDFRADGEGDPGAVGPLCDTPVTVNVSGDGISGEATITIAGTGPPPSSDTLAVWTNPAALAPGDSAGVFARHYTTGCMPGELADSTMTTFLATPAQYGSLEFEGQRGQLLDVLYAAAKAGAVQFVADGEKPLYDEEVQITGSALALTGASVLVVEGGKTFEPCNTGDPLIDSPEVQRLFRELWAASNYHDTEDPTGPPNPIENRLERLGVIVADGGSVAQAFAAPPGWYTNATSGRLDATIPGGTGFDADDIMVHTHPATVGEQDPFSPFDFAYESKASPPDFSQLDVFNINFGMDEQLIIDADHIFFHDQSWPFTRRYPRCGY